MMKYLLVSWQPEHYISLVGLSVPKLPKYKFTRQQYKMLISLKNFIDKTSDTIEVLKSLSHRAVHNTSLQLQWLRRCNIFSK